MNEAAKRYTVQLSERDYQGPRLACEVSDERYGNAAAASAAAKAEAFHLSVQLRRPIAIRIFEDERVYLSHIMPSPA